MSARAVLLALFSIAAIANWSLFAHRQETRVAMAEIGLALDSATAQAIDARLTLEVDRIRLALERARSQPAKEAETHLALAISDGVLTLERGEIVLRSAAVEAEVPRGVHLIEVVEARGIRLEGGILVQPAIPGDTTEVAAGTIILPRSDFDAIRPNVRVGQSAYFF